jgi:hypothetical protein
VPTGYELGLGVAVQSYDGKLFFGLTADAHVAPDVARLREYIQVCFRDLCKAAGVKMAPRVSKARAPKRQKAVEAVDLTPPAEEPVAPAEAVLAEPVLAEPVSSKVA